MDHQTQNKPTFNERQAMWRYQVTATLKDHASIKPYLEWLFDGHVHSVCQWAEQAEVVHLEGNDHLSQHPPQVMSIYWFTSQAQFERYKQEGAPLLRAEGIAFSESIGGIEFERKHGWAWQVRGEG
jgi:hypothetical protein